MPRDINLNTADVDLLREGCSAKDGRIRMPGSGDLQADFARTVSATHLAQLGYLEPADPADAGAGWRIKPDLRPQIRAVLKGL